MLISLFSSTYQTVSSSDLWFNFYLIFDQNNNQARPVAYPASFPHFVFRPMARTRHVQGSRPNAHTGFNKIFPRVVERQEEEKAKI